MSCRLQFASRRVGKIYLALVHGHVGLLFESGATAEAVRCVIEEPLARHEGRSVVDPRGRSAETEVLKAGCCLTTPLSSGSSPTGASTGSVEPSRGAHHGTYGHGGAERHVPSCLYRYNAIYHIYTQNYDSI